METIRSPFKFLDPYTLKDRKIFFGRSQEIETLYKMAFQTDIMLIYGRSGTGKTSLVQCGLGNRFNESDWFDIFVRKAKTSMPPCTRHWPM
ncbi:MAG: ATP-binding protein [Saprospiraceae bacterium]